MSTPQNLADQLKGELFKCLVDKYKVQGICMVMQALLSLYSYNATSGIIVDIGQRMEILPIYEGFIIEGGVSRQSYGGQKVTDSLNSSLTANKYVYVTPVEQLIVRYIMEQVSDIYSKNMIPCASSIHNNFPIVLYTAKRKIFHKSLSHPPPFSGGFNFAQFQRNRICGYMFI